MAIGEELMDRVDSVEFPKKKKTPCYAYTLIT